ncbi:MAG: hypothetical protein ABIP02_05660, partial [Arenimonas sp.]
DPEEPKQWFQQVILAKPETAPAWYGLGIQLMDVESDDTIVGIFATGEMLFLNTVADKDSRTRINTFVRSLPDEKQKKFAMLNIRALQLAVEMQSKGVEIKTPDNAKESLEIVE